jgi:5-methyltetrahydrofolate--homocysteine methyltransferase
MTTPLAHRFAHGPLVVGDGAMGTELQRAGLEPGACGDAWSLTHPDRVHAIHASYVDAGAELVLTNTFGTNRFVLGRYGLASRVADVARASARLARQAAGNRASVLGDVGPCGGLLEPLGEVRPPDLEASLRETMAALLEEGVDGLLVETMTAIDEFAMALRVARELGAPVVVASMAFDRSRDRFRTMMGVTPEEAAATARDGGATLVGANCGRGLEPPDFAELGRALNAASGLEVMLQPNAGQPVLRDEIVVYPLSPDAMADQLLTLVPVARVVGGCCGTTPEHIRTFAQRVKTAR